MNTTYQEQINAIQRARKMLESLNATPENKAFDEALNDAGSTIAAINITPNLQEFVILVNLLKKVFNRNCKVTFDGEVMEQIAKIVNPEDKGNYHNKT